LILIHGLKKVDYAGIQKLGYPGSWAISYGEIQDVKQFFTEKGV